MFKFGKKYLDKANKKLDNISSNDIAKGAKKVSGAVLEEGVDIAKDGIFAVIHGIIFKVIMAVIFIVIIITAGRVGGSVAIDKLTSHPIEIQKAQ